MEELYLRIADRLQNNVEGLSLIDEDTGQLIESADGYPVTFPCALVDVSTVDWASCRGTEQRGTAYITIKHAFDCHEDTHLSSYPYNQFEHLKRRSEQHRQLCSALHAYKFAVATSELQRTQSRHYTLYGRIKVYEVTFKVQVADNLLASE